LRVVIIGHSYLEKENQKNLDSISNFVELTIISPNSSDGMIFNYHVNSTKIENKNWVINLHQKITFPTLPSPIYILKSWHLGLKKIEPDIIHIEVDPFHPLFLQVYLYKIIFSPKSKIICTIKQNTYTSRNFFIDKIKDFIAKLFSKKVDHFIAVNKGVRNIYYNRFKVPKNKITISTQLGVDTILFNDYHCAMDKESLVVGYVGRLIEYKGVLDLVNAVEEIRLSGIELKLFLLGEGPLRETMLSKKYNWLTIFNPIPHHKVVDFLRNLDIFVMPSRNLKYHEEHDSHALMEAMAVGIPSIATKSGSNIEVLSNAGILIEPEKIEELVGAIKKMINDLELRNKYSKKGRSRIIKEYSIENIALNYKNIYKKINA
jgi:glycosyltransferase involved in cell wall biosynthesis